VIFFFLFFFSIFETKLCENNDTKQVLFSFSQSLWCISHITIYICTTVNLHDILSFVHITVAVSHSFQQIANAYGHASIAFIQLTAVL